MNREEAVKLLTDFNNWRRGKELLEGMPNPTEVGKAIDFAISTLSKEEEKEKPYVQTNCNCCATGVMPFPNCERCKGTGIIQEEEKGGEELGLVKFDKQKPPKNRVVLFVWWHRNGIETSQKCCGFITNSGKLITDLTFPKSQHPTFWKELFLTPSNKDQ